MIKRLWRNRSISNFAKKQIAMQGQEVTRKCLWCGAALRGRSDKKFCSVNCRNTYNNKKADSITRLVKITNHALRKNRNILAELYQSSLTENIVSKEILQYKGFQFRYHTETIKEKDRPPLYVLYDFSYQVLGKNQVRILPVPPTSFATGQPSG